MLWRQIRLLIEEMDSLLFELNTKISAQVYFKVWGTRFFHSWSLYTLTTTTKGLLDNGPTLKAKKVHISARSNFPNLGSPRFGQVIALKPNHLTLQCGALFCRAEPTAPFTTVLDLLNVAVFQQWNCISKTLIIKSCQAFMSHVETILVYTGKQIA